MVPPPANGRTPASGNAVDTQITETLDEEEDLCVGEDEDMGGDYEDIDYVDDGSTLDESTNKFDEIVEALEDVLLDLEFEAVREDFCRDKCGEFEDTPENKLSYTHIFDQYHELIEGSLERALSARLPDFSMAAFLTLLEARKDELMGEMFELLASLADFESFKELMLSYKAEMAAAATATPVAAAMACTGAAAPACAGGRLLAVSCSAMPIHKEEQEDGDARPELDFALHVSAFRGK